MQHPYCYPATDVLRNKEDIRDNDKLEKFERWATANRLETLPRNLPITVGGAARFMGGRTGRPRARLRPTSSG
jgi:hypothetical protein